MAEYLEINGQQKPLLGEVKISGAKNAALPLLFASLLSKEETVFTNLPELQDITITLKILESLGSVVKREKGSVFISTPKVTSFEASYALVRSLRASFWLLGPILARTGEARVSLPGGDAIGARPVDLHLKGLEALGAEIEMKHGTVRAVAKSGLKGARIELSYPSVGATHQLLLTAALIPEESEIIGAAREPEVVALSEHLQKMGARIEGAGSSHLKILGAKELGPSKTEILGDRIEAATFMCASAICGGDINLQGIDPSFLTETSKILIKAGAKIKELPNGLEIKSSSRPKAVSFETQPFPGLATDVQPLLMAVMAVADGVSTIDETVFENRFTHVPEFLRFGAKIKTKGNAAFVEGVPALSGAPTEAPDIRAAAALVLLALFAKDKSAIHNIYHLDRGYENFTDKFISLGAEMRRVPDLFSQEITFGC